MRCVCMDVCMGCVCVIGLCWVYNHYGYVKPTLPQVNCYTHTHTHTHTHTYLTTLYLTLLDIKNNIILLCYTIISLCIT